MSGVCDFPSDTLEDVQRRIGCCVKLMRLMQFLGERNKNCLEILRRTDVNSMVTIEREDYYINFVYIFL